MHIEIGESISSVCKRAIELARETGQDQTFHFNETPLTAWPNGSPQALEIEWNSKLESTHRNREIAKRTAEIVERVRHLLRMWKAESSTHGVAEVNVRTLDALSLIALGEHHSGPYAMVLAEITRAKARAKVKLLRTANENQPGPQANAGGGTANETQPGPQTSAGSK